MKQAKPTKYCHVLGVATERCDVVACPAQGKLLVHQPVVRKLLGGALRLQLAQRQPAENIQAVVGRHDHHAPLG